jgi:hypothetical protein
MLKFLRRFKFYAAWRNEFNVAFLCFHLFDRQCESDLIIIGVQFLKFWINVYFE